ncbi:MAG TPA: winged helix-turn-helix domain-containing protein [Pseudorhizobium sp.]|nr:winged helix-turn-helix domain-containing protein [Pseudorhizobium sp.]
MTPAGKRSKLILRVDFPQGDRLGRGKIELLEHIVATGSISAAGRAMGMSYRRAWLLVDAMNRMFDEPVIASRKGGKQGGGAVLTGFGTELLHRLKAMARTADAALDADLRWLEARRRPVDDAGLEPEDASSSRPERG